MNKEGLIHLHWELFDSPDAPGSGYRYMEREPVLILDDILIEHHKWRPKIELAYVTESYGNMRGLPSSSSHRTGNAILLRAKNPQKRMFIVKNLILRGVERIGIGMDHVYFDTDLYLKGKALYIQ